LIYVMNAATSHICPGVPLSVVKLAVDEDDQSGLNHP
jgi:hypothetical protein